MILGNLIKKVLSKKDKKDKPMRLLVIGVNHYNIWDPESDVLKAKVPKNATHLNFPNVMKTDFEYLCLTGNLGEKGNYKPVCESDLENKIVVDISGLNFVRVMMPQYVIIEDGRLFSASNVESMPHHVYRVALRRLRCYEEEG